MKREYRLSSALTLLTLVTASLFSANATAAGKTSRKDTHGPMIVITETVGGVTTLTHLYDYACPWPEIGANEHGPTHLAMRSDGTSTVSGCWGTSAVHDLHHANFEVAWQTGAGFTPLTVWSVSTSDYRFTEYGNALLAALQKRDGRAPKFPPVERETPHYSPSM